MNDQSDVSARPPRTPLEGEGGPSVERATPTAHDPRTPTPQFFLSHPTTSEFLELILGIELTPWQRELVLARSASPDNAHSASPDNDSMRAFLGIGR